MKKIVTTISLQKMRALYQAVSENLAAMKADVSSAATVFNRRRYSSSSGMDSLAIRGGSQTAGPRTRDSSPPNPVDRWAGLSRARRR